MGDQALVMYVRREMYDKHGVRLPWPSMPAKPKPRPRIASRTQRDIEQTPRADTGKTPLEVLSRITGSTTFKEPSNGRSTRHGGMCTLDIAGALGYVKDPLQQRLAMALACMTDAEWESIQALAFPRLLTQLLGSHATRGLVGGKKRHRARLMLHTVFHDLALCRTPMHVTVMAKALDVSPKDCRKLYQVTAGFIETEAQAGARTAIDALYNDE